MVTGNVFICLIIGEDHAENKNLFPWPAVQPAPFYGVAAAQRKGEQAPVTEGCPYGYGRGDMK